MVKSDPAKKDEAASRRLLVRDRIQQAVKDLGQQGYTKSQVAEKLDITRQALNSSLNTGRMAKHTLVQLAKLASRSFEWFVDEEISAAAQNSGGFLLEEPSGTYRVKLKFRPDIVRLAESLQHYPAHQVRALHAFLLAFGPAVPDGEVEKGFDRARRARELQQKDELIDSTAATQNKRRVSS